MKTSTNSNQFALIPFFNRTLSPIQFAFLKSRKVSGFSQEFFDPKSHAELSSLSCSTSDVAVDWFAQVTPEPPGYRRSQSVPKERGSK